MDQPSLARGGVRRARSGDGLVRRGELFDRFSGTVILVSAPAGSGKTVLVRSWVEAAVLHGRVAWVSVERGERDAQRFWLSVIDALAGAVGVVRRVDPAPSFRGEAAIAQLLADLGSLEGPAVLVIDDLHELESADALRWLERFLERLPVGLRVVLATRKDPRLGLHRLRLAGQLSDLRAAELRFSLEATAQLLRAAGIALSDGGVALLYERTEGWAAGLRLAAISLAGHPDPERFVTEFSGSERTVAGYLFAEVLERQPAEVRELLLRTSVLDRVCGQLADYLTGASGADRILQELEDANAFVSSLDVGRSWFRYHHLFADLLQLELRRVSPAMVGSLHRAAARWFEEHGELVEAVRHAQAAPDWSQAARLLTDCRIGLILDGRLATERALLEAFPAQVAAADPELAVAFAGVRLRDGSLDEAEAYVAVAEQQAAGVPEERKQLFAFHLASVRLALARRRVDLGGALEAMGSLQAALEALPPGERMRSDDARGLALMTLGITELWALRLEDARRHLEEGVALARRIGRPYLEVGCLAHLGVAAPLCGLSPTVALDFSEKAVALAEEHGLGTDSIVAMALAVGGGALTSLGRLHEADRWLDRAVRTLHPDQGPGTEVALYHARGLLRLAQGRFEDALAAFRRAEQVQGMLSGEHALTVDVRGDILLTQVRMGEVAAARAALATMAEDERDRAEMRNAAATIELAEGDPEQATQLLAPVIECSVKALNPTWAAISALLLDATAREQLGETRSAEASLERALDLAEPDGLILQFTLFPVEEMLRRLPRHRTPHATLLATILDVLAGVSPPPRGGPAPLLEELSAAELRVVRYLPSHLTMSEIAAELYVSPNTVRAHVRHIYAKLDAHGRAEAVARARELGLLAPSLRRR